MHVSARGAPVPLAAAAALCSVLRPGLEVRVNVRRAGNRLARLQATAVWPAHLPPPHYRVDPGKLEHRLARWQGAAVRAVVPLALDGLPGRSHGAWSARVKRLVDDNWGLVEVKAVTREAGRETTRRRLCVFHKSDVW